MDLNWPMTLSYKVYNFTIILKYCKNEIVLFLAVNQNEHYLIYKILKSVNSSLFLKNQYLWRPMLIPYLEPAKILEYLPFLLASLFLSFL